MNSYQHEPSPPAMPSGQSAVQKFFRGPGLIASVITSALVLWWLISFLTPEPIHTERAGPINYYGIAEVMDIAQTPSTCFVYIRRETGQETRQKMAKASCRQVRVGDMINIENGQYVSTVPNPYLTPRPGPYRAP